MRHVFLLFALGAVACGESALLSPYERDGGGNPDAPEDSGLDARPSDADDSGRPGEHVDAMAAGEPDAAASPEDDSGAGDGDGIQDPADGGDGGPIIVGPGPDAGSEPVPYFERSCPSACPAVPDPEKPDLQVDTDICYSWPEGLTCTFYCTEYFPAEDHWVSYTRRKTLCASLGGTCVYLDSDGNPIPGNQELVDESEYCLPPDAPTRP